MVQGGFACLRGLPPKPAAAFKNLCFLTEVSGKGGSAAKVTSTEFSGLVRQYQNLVYTVCYQLVKNPQTAEDLAQDTFVAAFTHIDACPPEHYKAWLARIAANKAKDHLKSAWNRRVSAPGDENLPETPLHGSAPPGPEELAVSRDEAEAIRQMVLELKEPYLKAATLFFLEERSVEEIARVLGRPPKTVHTQLYRARLMLRRRIEERGRQL